jgi:hypothetical protein
MAREVVRFLGEATLDDPGPARERVHELAGSLLRIYSGERSIGPGVGT